MRGPWIGTDLERVPTGRPGEDDLRRALDLVMTGRATSRREIATALRLRSTRVSDLVATLLETGLIHETRGRSHGRGRPASILAGVPAAVVVVLVQVSSRTLRASLVDLLGSAAFCASEQPDADADADVMASALGRLIDRCLSQARSEPRPCEAVFCLPGVLDRPSQRWLFSSRWPHARNVDLSRIAKSRGLSSTVIRNLDAELEARLAVEPVVPDSLLVIHWGYGIGAAFASRGSVLNAGSGRFGEIGHWTLERARGRRCRCGREGCLEAVAALWALSPTLRDVVSNLSEDEVSFADQARVHDLMASRDMERALRAMTDAAANLCRVLFPQRLVVTGPFVMNEGLWRRLKAMLASAGIIAGVPDPEIMRGQRSEALETSGATTPIFERRVRALLSHEAVSR